MIPANIDARDLRNGSFMKLLSSKEVTDMLGCCERSLRSWVKSGRIESVRTATGRYYFRPDEVNRFVTERNKKKKTQGEASGSN